MKIIVREAGNIGPFDSIEALPDRLRCYRNGQPEDYPLIVLGEYTISENEADAPIRGPSAAEISDAVAAKAQLINDERASAIEAGCPYNFGEIADAIQTRPQDQVNLLTIWTAAREAQEAGVTEPVIEFRAISDTNYMLTPAEALAMTGAVRAHGYAAYQASWARKAALEAIDLNAPNAMEQIAAV